VGHPTPLNVVHRVGRDEPESNTALQDEPERQESCPERSVGERLPDAAHGAAWRSLGLDEVLDEP